MQIYVRVNIGYDETAPRGVCRKQLLFWPGSGLQGVVTSRDSLSPQTFTAAARNFPPQVPSPCEPGALCDRAGHRPMKPASGRRAEVLIRVTWNF